MIFDRKNLTLDLSQKSNIYIQQKICLRIFTTNRVKYLRSTQFIFQSQKNCRRAFNFLYLHKFLFIKTRGNSLTLLKKFWKLDGKLRSVFNPVMSCESRIKTFLPFFYIFVHNNPISFKSVHIKMMNLF